MSVNNVVEYYLLAVKYETKDNSIKPNGLRRKCLGYIQNNLSAFTKTEEFQTLDGEFFKDFNRLTDMV